MDISEKQAVWREQKPLFEAEFIHSHLLPFFNFNENTGDYEIKSECVNNTDDEDRKVAYETLMLMQLIACFRSLSRSMTGLEWFKV